MRRVTGQAMNIRYSNFKSEVAAVERYGYAHLLNKVWDVMHEVEDLEAGEMLK